MAANRLVAALVTLPACIVGWVSAAVIYIYLPNQANRSVVAMALVLATIAIAVLLFRFVSRVCVRGSRGIVVLVLFAALAAVPFLSMFMHGQVIYSRFGLTVYGLVPVPFLDVTVNKHGVLWFRPKSHLATVDEARHLVSDDVEVLVIGTGWEGVMKAEDALANLKNVEVRILKTPQAFEVFNRMKSAGRKVVLLAHSTC